MGAASMGPYSESTEYGHHAVCVDERGAASMGPYSESTEYRRRSARRRHQTPLQWGRTLRARNTFHRPAADHADRASMGPYSESTEYLAHLQIQILHLLASMGPYSESTEYLAGSAAALNQHCFNGAVL